MADNPRPAHVLEEQVSLSHLQLHLAQKVNMLTILSEISNLKLFISFHPQSGECHRAPRGQQGRRTNHNHQRQEPLEKGGY